jgi:sugar phosphate isomerase/epimerase
MMRPFLSLSHFTVIEADPLTLVEVAAGAGFDAVTLRVAKPPGAAEIVDVAGDRDLRRRIKVRLEATGVQLLAIDAVFVLAETDVASLRPALDAGAELGARNVLVCGFDPERSRLAGNLKRLCEEANGRGLKLMLEFLPYTHVRTLREAHDLLREIAPVDAGIAVDALHLDRSGGTAADIAAYDPKLFPYYQLCDAPADAPPAGELRAEARGGRLYPGEGGLRLRDLVTAFDPDTAAEIEAPSARHAGTSLHERARLAAEACHRLFDQVNVSECGSNKWKAR